MRRTVTSPVLVLIGASYRTAPLPRREALALDSGAARALLARLAATDGICEAAVLSTCSRSEFYVVADGVEAALRGVTDAVRETRGCDLSPEAARAEPPSRHGPPSGPDEPRHAVGVQAGAGAARHLLRVASGIDSPILGDTQVLGQVKEAYALARESGTVGAVLHRLFETALRAGRRTRRETGIGQGSKSTAAAAADLVARSVAPLRERDVLVVGAGETASLTARHLAKRAPRSIVVANRTLGHAEALAREVGGRAVRFDAMRDALVNADVVVSATGSSAAVISSELLVEVMRARPSRPLLALDLAVPRDIEWQAAAVAGVTLHAIDGVQAEVSRHLRRSRGELPRVQAIVDEELDRFGEWLQTMEAADVIRAIRSRAEHARVRALDARFPSPSTAARARADRESRLAMNRLLHEPTLRLRALAGQPGGPARLAALREQLQAQPAGLRWPT